MTPFLTWYFLLIILGLLAFPLAYRLFPALPDRGYSLARGFGLLIWGYVFWAFASLQIAQNDAGGLLLGLVILGGLSGWAFVNCRTEIMPWVRANRSVIVTTELLFLAAFGLMSVFRAANPEIVGTEKPMELMFINGIMNSPMFPPRDLWLSGYSISYYYFGYVMTSMLALFTGVPATMAFNLMIALIFALSAVGAYGIIYNLLCLRLGHQPIPSGRSFHLLPLFGPLFLLLISNVEGFLEVLHRRGLFWQFNADGSAASPFWTWLDMKELSQPPALPLEWIPERFWWWWRASRVVQDYDLTGRWTGDVIDEFPAFSYLLGDLHPHVLAMPFNLLAIAVALNILLGGWRGNIDLFFGRLHISRTGFFVSALVLGGLAFLNTWDILPGAALIVLSYALARVREAGWGWERLENVLLLGFPLAVTAFLMYLPFYIGFDSQAGGILPNFMFPTRGAHLWVMWGTLFLPLFAYLIYLWRGGAPAAWRSGLFTGLGIVLFLLLTMLVIGFVGLRLKPDLVLPILESQGRDVGTFIADSMLRRMAYIGSLLTLLALLVPALAFLFKAQHNPASSFTLLLIAVGTLIIIGPDFLYLRDNFGYRINTVFKFYYQSWIALSLAAAYGLVVLLQTSREAAVSNPHQNRFGYGAVSALVVLVLVVGLAYPVIGVFSKTNNLKPPFGYTLDDFDRVQRENPDEAAAMLWLRSAPDGVVAEAIGGQYSAYARISIYSGLPTVLGWPGHESQWRDHALQGSREQDIRTLYTASDWAATQQVVDRYDIRYIVVGNLERSTYQVNEDKFNRFLKPVFQQGSVTIYEVP